jgi:hypothetical protein
MNNLQIILVFFLKHELCRYFLKKNTGKVVRIVAKGLLATDKTGCFACIIRKKSKFLFVYRFCNSNDMHHKANQTTVKSLTHWQLFNYSRSSQKCIRSLPYWDQLAGSDSRVRWIHFNIIPHVRLCISSFMFLIVASGHILTSTHEASRYMKTYNNAFSSKLVDGQHSVSVHIFCVSNVIEGASSLDSDLNLCHR